MRAPAGPSRVCGCGVLGRSPAQGGASGAALGQRCGSGGGAAARVAVRFGRRRGVSGAAFGWRAFPCCAQRSDHACSLRKFGARQSQLCLSRRRLAQNRGPAALNAPVVRAACTKSGAVDAGFVHSPRFSALRFRQAKQSLANPQVTEFCTNCCIFPSSIAPNLVQMRAIFLRGSC